MPNPLEKAIKSGVRMNNKIGDLFAQVGTTAHPRGAITTLYRNGRMSMNAAMKENNALSASGDVMRSMRRDLQREISSVFNDAISLGVEEAQRQLKFYDINSGSSIALTDETQSALDVVMSRFDAQEAAIRALVLTDADPAQITGDEDRTGVLAGSELTAASAYWSTFLIWNAFDSLIQNNQAGLNFQKQAIAVLDQRTTDCCLRVHGQIRNFDEPFKLTGSPRFADEMDWPGFHWYCRTSGVLYLPGFDDGITAQLRERAMWFLREREQGRNPDSDPANAF